MDSGNEKRKKENNIEFIFTSTDNQKNNEENDNITIHLGQCEKVLKDEYNISNNDSLYL